MNLHEASTRAMAVVDYCRGKHLEDRVAHFEMVLLLGEMLEQDTMSPAVHTNGQGYYVTAQEKAMNLLTAELLQKHGREGLGLDPLIAATKAQEEKARVRAEQKSIFTLYD